MTSRPPSILLVPYRWGSDLVGGAETLHRRLAMELRDLGCQVSVWTTTAHNFRPFCHWGNLWEEFQPAGTTTDDGITVTRFPAIRYPKAILGLLAKSIQRDWEAHPPTIGDESLARIAAPTLGAGWHEAEPLGDGEVRRWTAGIAVIHLPPGLPACNIRLEGVAPWAVELTVLDGSGRVLTRERVRGEFTLECAVTGAPTRLFLISNGARRPFREFRTLGVQATRLSIGGEEASFWSDWRHDLSDGEWWAAAARRPRWAGMFFDALRGPNSPALQRALSTATRGFDAVVAMNLPWRLFLPQPRRGGGPLRVVLPLFHPADGYYYWEHYAAAIRGADLVLAMSEGSANSVLRPINPQTAVIGAPVWSSGEAQAAPRSGDGPLKVLTVCRKVPEKGYRAVADSVMRLRATGLAVVGTGCGPDVDGYRLPDGFTWEGVVPEERLRALYREADVFVLMSESESFGMVVAEAWHAGLPVVVNRHCRALASLVTDGGDGLLASPGPECDLAIRRLAESPELRERLGAAGCERARREFVRGACGTRFLEAMRPLLDSRGRS